jgi:hypothetical protein
MSQFIRFEVVGGFGLRQLDKLFIPEFAQAEDMIASLLRDNYKRKILEVRAYRTGALYRSPIRDANAFLEGGRRIRDVIADTRRTSEGGRDYADIVERGRKPPVNYPGRFPAMLAIESSQWDIDKILDDTANRIIEVIQTE